MTDNKALAKNLLTSFDFDEIEVDIENEEAISEIVNKYKELNEKCDIVLQKLKTKKTKPKETRASLAKSK